MKLGLFGGGFKPFTTGHFSKLALASKENDQVILFYGLAERKKGSDYFYTKEMAKEVMEIMKVAIEREMKNVKVVEAKPTPLVMMFETISQVAGVQKTGKFIQLKNLGITPSGVSEIRVYGDEESQQNFKKYLGTEREERYFGFLYQEGRIHFDTGMTDNNEMTRIIDAMSSSYSGITKDELIAKSNVRGSEVRASIQSRDFKKIDRFLPPILNDKEKNAVIQVLYKGLEESALRSLIRKIIIGD
jgi:hypothetical protein